MKILANRKIKRLFLCVASADIGFVAIVLLCMNLKVKNVLVYVMIAAICMMAAVFVFLYLYFREQNKIMEDAISRIRDYISGDRDVRLECNEEGELYRLFNLIPELTVEQNIIFPVLLDYQKPNKKYLEELLEVLGLKKRRNHLPSQLSGGQQQRVAIGRALITRPALILADEPTGNLDTQNTSEVIALLKEASRKYEQTIVMITHSRGISQTADRILQVSDGVLTDFGRCRE